MQFKLFEHSNIQLNIQTFKVQNANFYYPKFKMLFNMSVIRFVLSFAVQFNVCLN